ncbi:hypothetical protein BN946_scf184347.g4 [Trametes cinnabarina]|uniref:Cytochrome P450 n=1 Tax=Pycnoporus cinnabarinus TaxID=5643 RepID=A0A060S127_PYCCI|nr:hypothetical protein BN946_scf184347.g4 [Trametes cinnabarina]
MAHPVVAFVVLVCLPILVYRYLKRRTALRRPPGPPGLSLLGNTFDVPAPNEYPWLKYHALCKQYGTEILRLNALGTKIVMIDTLRAAVELLDKRSSLYSDRFVSAQDSAGITEAWSTATTGASRKMTHRELHTGPMNKYRPVLLNNAHDFLRRLSSGRGTLVEHLKHAIGANVMKIAYDINVLPEDDPFVKLAEAGQQCIGRCTTGGVYLVEILPFLKYVPSWLPGAGFKRQAAIWREAAEKQLHVAYDDFLERMVTRSSKLGKAGHCMAQSLIDVYGIGDPVTEKHLRATTATVYLGGAETSASALHTFFLAMVLYPRLQAKAREELERVIGTNRLPTFDDFGSIPYIDALIKELLRWYPIVPLLMPHKLSEDDMYDGYFLEKGSLVMVNVWAILHDEARYPDPYTFNPDRFLKDGALDPDVFDSEDAAFGFGRRVCPG